ncbi:MAG: 1-phosphofructokinase family hexose kinase [Rhodococcus sp.]|nr:1-phosphofructokinase family hexose kinase [Rhodococcus sp. (in: high G+C Gram-positive bacteria)]
MIVTLTANPSIDRTVELGGTLERGSVLRARASSDDPGGKGVNVSRALVAAGTATLAVIPAATSDPLLAALHAHNVPYSAIPIPGPVRTNITIAEPDGTTTKINEAGSPLDSDAAAALIQAISAESADWIVLCGSLPPGLPANWYAPIVASARRAGRRVAVDTSEEPLLALAENFPESAPDLLKPNSDELGQLTGTDGRSLEDAARGGDFWPAASAAHKLVARGVSRVLVTLGAAGALLVDDRQAWFAAAPPISPRSTVGAGDCALAGYLIAAQFGADGPGCLQSAVAYGSAAAALPGTTIPGPGDIDLSSVSVEPLGTLDPTGSTTPAHELDRSTNAVSSTFATGSKEDS